MYRGRRISPAEVAFIGKLITEHPEASRRALSIQLKRGVVVAPS